MKKSITKNAIVRYLIICFCITYLSWGCVAFYSRAQNVNFNTYTWMLILEMINAILIEVLASLAEQERIRNLTRQAEGISAAKLKGKHLGRPKAVLPEEWDEIYSLWKGNEITAVEAMKRAGLKKSTFYKLVKLTEETYDE